MIARYITGQPVDRRWVSANNLSDRLKVAVVSSEDSRFCSHAGIDWRALETEIDAWSSGEQARGASTISMQLARNLFLWNNRSSVRKLFEIPLALYLDLVLSKERILEIYLNIAEWGPAGEFGASAGANYAFGAEASALSWNRASLLAVTLPNPLVRNAANPSSGLSRLARINRSRASIPGDWNECIDPEGLELN